MDIEKQVEEIVRACEDKKAIDIKVLDLSMKSSVADKFVIASGNSSTQVKAISDSVEEAMDELTGENFIREGYSAGKWIVLDYTDVVVHIFHKDEREFYDLERLWEENTSN